MPFQWLAEKWHATIFKIVSITVLIIVIFLGYQTWTNLIRAYPDISYDSDEEQFKYGAIGLGMNGRVPYYLFKILPDLFPEKLPGPGGWASFGVIFEEGKELPVGFSKRRIGFPSVEPNCALCHTGSYKQTPDDKQQLLLGAPAHQLDLEAFQWFLYDCAEDPKFNPDTLMAHIEKIADLTWMEKVFNRYLGLAIK